MHRRADQQRHLHGHRPGRAAVRDRRGCAPSRPAATSSSPRPTGSRGIVAPDGEVVERAPVRTQAVARAPGCSLPGPDHPGRPVLGCPGASEPGRRSFVFSVLLALVRPLSSAPGRWHRERARGSGTRRVMTQQSRSRARRAGRHPDLQRGRQPGAGSSGGVRAAHSRAWTSWSSTTAPRTARASSPTTLAAADPQVSVVHRTAKAGLGAAYLHGFAVALERGYDVIGEMDADGSHQPEQLPRLLDGARRRRPGDRLALGARAASVVNWPLVPQGALGRRQRLRPGAARHPGARRHRRLPAVPAYDAGDRSTWPAVQSVGYCFQADLAWRTVQAGPAGRRGADRVRGAGARGVEDEPRRGHRVAAPDHRVGPRASARRQVARRTLEAETAPPPGRGGRRARSERMRRTVPVVGAGAAVRGGAGRRDLRADPGRPGRSAPGGRSCC